MDDIEQAIRDAWQRVGPRLLANPKELKRRLARREGRVLSRPPRAWCLALRASDRRMERFLERYPQTAEGESIRMDARMLRELCQPVRISSQGEMWDEVAKRVGRGFRGLHRARVTGRLRAHHVPLLAARWGNPVPVLQCREELDPNWRGLEGADRAWGWTAKYLVNRIPSEFTCTLERVPIWRTHVRRDRYEEEVHPEVGGAPRKRSDDRLPPPKPDYVWYKWSKTGEYLGDDPAYWRKSPDDPGIPGGPVEKKRRKRKHRPSVSGGSLHFRGWMWICPKCGKQVRVLYLPVRGINLLEGEVSGEIRNPKLEIRNKFKAQGENSKTECLEHSNLGHSDLFGISDFDIRVSPACYSCHRIRGFTRVDKNSWNELVGYLSGGLLYGREVAMPAWFRDQGMRRVEYRPRLNRPAPRRQQVLRRMLNGWTITQIARDLKMCKQQVCDSIRALCRQEGVKDRAELAQKLGSKHPQPMRRRRCSGVEVPEEVGTADGHN